MAGEARQVAGLVRSGAFWTGMAGNAGHGMARERNEMAGDDVEKRLSALAKKAGGLLTAEVVVEDARNPSSPLHAHFDWDNDVAAEKWRLEQARRLIRSVKITVEVVEDLVAVPKYVHVPEVGYRETAVVRKTEDTARAALDYELQRLAASLARVVAVADGLGLRGEVREVENVVKATIEKLAA